MVVMIEAEKGEEGKRGWIAAELNLRLFLETTVT
jgi:hypothetical protein